jgi:predicted MFS family arabinose efflux permease
MTADPGPGVFAALRNRDFALLWGGQAVSLAGNGVFAVALPLAVLQLTRSPVNLALVVAARTVPQVAALLAGGALADRWRRRLIMLVSDSVCGAAVCVIAILVAAGLARLWELAALSVIFGLAGAFFKPASTAIVADIVPAEALVSASSLSSLSQSLAQYLLGPLAGGFVVAVTGTAWGFGLDAASFAVSAACLALMRPSAGRPSPGPAASLLAGIREGLSYCRSQVWLWWSMIAVGIGNLVCFVPLALLEALLVRHVFHAGPIALGVVYAASGAGGAAASVAAARWPVRQNRLLAIWLSWAGAGAAALLLGLSPWLWAAAVCAGLAWGGVTYGNVAWFPLLQTEVPRELLGRVSSVDWMLSLGLTPLGTLAGGAAAAFAGVRLTLAAGGVLAAATCAVLLIPGVAEPGRPATSLIRRQAG